MKNPLTRGEWSARPLSPWWFRATSSYTASSTPVHSQTLASPATDRVRVLPLLRPCQFARPRPERPPGPTGTRLASSSSRIGGDRPAYPNAHAPAYRNLSEGAARDGPRRPGGRAGVAEGRAALVLPIDCCHRRGRRRRRYRQGSLDRRHRGHCSTGAWSPHTSTTALARARGARTSAAYGA
jgi:hypothetical protein